jgi:hypothetical protein
MTGGRNLGCDDNRGQGSTAKTGLSFRYILNGGRQIRHVDAKNLFHNTSSSLAFVTEKISGTISIPSAGGIAVSSETRGPVAIRTIPVG